MRDFNGLYPCIIRDINCLQAKEMIYSKIKEDSLLTKSNICFNLIKERTDVPIRREKWKEKIN